MVRWASALAIVLAAGCSSDGADDGSGGKADDLGEGRLHRLSEMIELEPTSVRAVKESGEIVLLLAKDLEDGAPETWDDEDVVTRDVSLLFVFERSGDDIIWGDATDASGPVLNLSVSLEPPLRAALIQHTQGGVPVMSRCPFAEVLDIDVEAGELNIDGTRVPFANCDLTAGENSAFELLIVWPNETVESLRGALGSRSWEVTHGLSGQLSEACAATCDQQCNDAGQCVECTAPEDCGDPSLTCSAGFTCIPSKIGGQCTGDSDCGDPNLFTCSGGACEAQACSGNPGTCIDTNTTSCGGALLTGLCPGPANVRCCAACTDGETKSGCVLSYNPFTTGEQVCSGGTWGSCQAKAGCGTTCEDYQGDQVCSGETGLRSCLGDGVRICTCSSGVWTSCGGCIL